MRAAEYDGASPRCARADLFPSESDMSSRSQSLSDSTRRPAPGGPERLQKILAAAGLGSRRHCEELIVSGRVEVDRRIVTELGAKADREHQEIRVDGVPLARPRLVYFLVNKPPGIVSTNSDPAGRPRVVDLVDYRGRLFTVGRLDMSSEGLILVTNDGELANRLTHPRYGIEKTYQVEVAGTLERKDLEQLRRGVHLAEGFARVVSAKVLRQYKQSTLLEIVLSEGRNREIRRLLARVGHKVERLKRVALGPVRLAELPTGAVRPLERDELRRLKQAAHGVKTKPPRRTKPARAAPAGQTDSGAGDHRRRRPRETPKAVASETNAEAGPQAPPRSARTRQIEIRQVVCRDEALDTAGAPLTAVAALRTSAARRFARRPGGCRRSPDHRTTANGSSARASRRESPPAAANRLPVAPPGSRIGPCRRRSSR